MTGPAVPPLQQVFPDDGPGHAGGNDRQEDDCADIARAETSVAQIQRHRHGENQVEGHEKHGENQRVFERQREQGIAEKLFIVIPAAESARAEKHVFVLKRVNENIEQRHQHKENEAEHLRQNEGIAG